MAAPTWQANGSPTATAAASTRTPTLPAHAANDILLVAAIKNDAGNLSISAGWNEVLPPEGNSNMSTGLWWKRAASGAETNPTVTSTTAADASNVLMADSFNVRGCITTVDPFEAAVWSGSPVSSTTPQSSSINTLGIDRLVACFSLVDSNQAHSGIPPATWTNTEDVTTATGGTAAIAIITKSVAAAGNVAAVTVETLTVAKFWRTLTLAFIPVGGLAVSDPPRRRGLNPLLTR